MTKHIGFLVIATSLLLTSCGQSADSSSEQSQSMVAEVPQKSQQVEVAKEPVAEKKEVEPESMSGSYITLAKFDSAKNEYANSDVVLFFNASWCSTCKVARDNIESDLSAIPANLTIVVVDYDSEIELRRKYGVVIQHTFVQINSSGQELAKWSGSVTAKAIAENLV